MAARKDAFATLQDVASLCHKHARGLPAQVDIKPHWSGVGFSLLNQRFVAPIGEVTEMLNVPQYTRLPGVKSWLRGVANVRGRLLTITDLGEFFGQPLKNPRRKRRILILDAGELYSGLMVDEVFGMQHFPADEFMEDTSQAEEIVRPFIKGCYEHDGARWFVFSPYELARDGSFYQSEWGV